MKIGLIVLSIGPFGKKGFYNLQEIGLAKALAKTCEKVKIFKLVSQDQDCTLEHLKGTENAEIVYLPSKSLGTNGIPIFRKLDTTLDVYICFSDTQLMFPMVYRWAQRNQIKLFPYIGVTKSHSTNVLKSNIINVLFARNIKLYKKCTCFAKNLDVQKFLEHKMVKSTILAPVGLDLGITKRNYTAIPPEELKSKYGYKSSDRVLLFIGRLTEEKQPLRMIDIFYELSKKCDTYKLLIIGTGELKNAVIAKINKHKLEEQIQIMDKVSNDDIWELYCMADVFVNLNKQEIFGMAILEAMYYGCMVVAQSAPGPNLIIENGISGYLIHNNTEALEAIQNGSIEKQTAVARVINHFTWESTAQIMLKAML